MKKSFLLAAFLLMAMAAAPAWPMQAWPSQANAQIALAKWPADVCAWPGTMTASFPKL